MVHTAYIYDHVRTPRGRGKSDGSLHTVPSNRLASGLLESLRIRHDLDTSLVDDLVLGCVDPVYEAGGDIARTVILESGYSESVCGIHLNRYCASGLDAINFGASKIMSGSEDIIISGGVESMSRIGLGASGGSWVVDPSVSFPSYFVPQGISADLIATKYGFSRSDVDSYAVESQRRARVSWDNGYFDGSIVPVCDVNGVELLSRDEHMRATDMQSLGSLSPSFAMMGELAGFDSVCLQRFPDLEYIDHVHHAGNSSGIVDGCGLVLLGSESGGESLGLRPRAKIHSFASIGSDPTLMLTGPIDVVEKLLCRSGVSLSDIDLFELNEAFSSVVLRFMDYFGVDHSIMNVCGGSISMGHPLGATGSMILGTLLDELERRDMSLGLVVLCIGAGMGTATLVERV